MDDAASAKTSITKLGELRKELTVLLQTEQQKKQLSAKMKKVRALNKEKKENILNLLLGADKEQIDCGVACVSVRQRKKRPCMNESFIMAAIADHLNQKKDSSAEEITKSILAKREDETTVVDFLNVNIPRGTKITPPTKRVKLEPLPPASPPPQKSILP
jgi:hypothetical protein